MSSRIYKVFECDYPDCSAVLLRQPNAGEAGDGWGQTPEGLDLCSDHYGYYNDMLAAFWDVNQSVDEVLKDEGILYTDKPELSKPVNVSTTQASTDKEDW